MIWVGCKYFIFESFQLKCVPAWIAVNAVDELGEKNKEKESI